MIKIQYRIKTGRWPNLKSPKRYTEKLQVYKTKYQNPLMHQCVDKYEVRNYVENKGLSEILNEFYGVYESPYDIDFDKLPNQFVIKSSLGSGGLNIKIVKDKDTVEIEEIISHTKKWLSSNGVGALYGREWAYSGNQHNRLIIEKYLKEDGGLTDYKFFCFNGEPKYIHVITGREDDSSARMGVYDVDFHKLPVYRLEQERDLHVLKKPENYDRMVEIARKLSADFPHVRVDLYNIKGKIYFGELTFYEWSGYFNYEPDEFDFQAGAWFTEYS